MSVYMFYVLELDRNTCEGDSEDDDATIGGIGHF